MFHFDRSTNLSLRIRPPTESSWSSSTFSNPKVSRMNRQPPLQDSSHFPRMRSRWFHRRVQGSWQRCSALSSPKWEPERLQCPCRRSNHRDGTALLSIHVLTSQDSSLASVRYECPRTPSSCLAMLIKCSRRLDEGTSRWRVRHDNGAKVLSEN